MAIFLISQTMTKLHIKLKPEFKNRIIAFGDSADALGKRNDLHKLLLLAYRANRQDYIDMFDDPPTEAQLKKASTDEALAAIPPNDAANSPITGVAEGQPSNIPNAGQIETVEESESKAGKKK